LVDLNCHVQSVMIHILLYPLQRSCRGVYWFHHVRPSVDKSYFISCLPVKRGGSLSFLTIFTFVVPELLDGFQILLRTKYGPSLVKIHWRMLILECSQGLWWTDGSVTISPRNFVGEGIITLEKDFYPMSYDNLSSVSQNVLKFYQLLTGEEGRIPFIFDNFHFCHSRVIIPSPTKLRGRICLQTDGHGETSIPPYNFVAGGIIICESLQTGHDSSDRPILN
jgi:hypothetical protein